MTRRALIKSVMTPFPYSIEAGASLDVARAMMKEHDIRHLPVTLDGALVGLLLKRDLRGLEPTSPPTVVGDICRDEPWIVDRNTVLDEVLLHMAGSHAESALVTREGKLVGVFTMVDACREYAKLLRKLAGLENDDSVA